MIGHDGVDGVQNCLLERFLIQCRRVQTVFSAIIQTARAAPYRTFFTMLCPYDTPVSRKGGMIVIVCVALVADWLIGMMLENLPGIALPFTYTVLIGPLVIVWYVIGELGSLAEHAVHMGADVPEWLPKILAAGKSAVDAAGDKIVGDEHHEEV